MSSKSYSAAYDQRTQFGSGSGLQVAPGGAVVSPGAGSVNAAAGAFVQQSVSTENHGFVAEDVAQILGMIEEDRAGERAALSGLGQSLAAGVLAQADTAAATLAATKAPYATTLTQIMPLLLLLVVGYFLLR